MSKIDKEEVEPISNQDQFVQLIVSEFGNKHTDTQIPNSDSEEVGAALHVDKEIETGDNIQLVSAFQ